MNKVWIMALAATFMFTSCMQDDDAGKPANGTLQLSLTGLSDLGPSQHYQAWLVIDGTPKSAGTFTVDASGNLSRTSFPYNRGELTSATGLMVTVEAENDANGTPSALKVLAGNFVSDAAELSTNHPDVLNVTFAGIPAYYVLGTPTTSPNDNDELQGLWFARTGIGSNAFAAGLASFPQLPAAWRYEAWVILNGIPVSMGKFQATDRPDQSNRFGGAAPGLPFPGEDFVANAPAGISFPQSLGGSQVMITVEPASDTDEKPFILQPFKGQVPANAVPNTNYTVANQAAQKMPKGTAAR